MIFKIKVELLVLALLASFVYSCKPEDDTDLPYILLVGANPFYVDSIGGQFAEPGYTGLDDIDGDLTARVIVDYPAIAGDSAKSYDIKYTLTDNSGNTFSTIRKVIVRNTSAYLEGYYLQSRQECDSSADSVFAANVIASLTANDQFTIHNFGNMGSDAVIACTIDRNTGKITIAVPQPLPDSATLDAVNADSTFITRMDTIAFQVVFSYSRNMQTQNCKTVYRK